MFHRSDGSLQFGQEPHRALIVNDFASALAPRLAQIFRGLHSPRSREQLHAELCGCGLEATAARSLIDDLLNHRILAATPTTAGLTIIGNTPLAHSLATLVGALGMGVYRSELPNDLDRLTALVPRYEHHPVVLVDCLTRHRHISAALLRALRDDQLLLPIDTFDGSYIIGPVRLGTRGPCPMCMELWRSESDPDWTHLSAQHDTQFHAPTTVIATAASAVASAVIQAAITDPPDTTLLLPGRRWIVRSSRIEEDYAHHHRYCPACFEATG